MSLAQAKGLRARTIFFQLLDCAMRCCRRSPAWPSALAGIMSGAILVEVVFAYPGIGFLLFRAISGNDYFVIQGVVLFVILSVGLALLILDFAVSAARSAHPNSRRADVQRIVRRVLAPDRHQQDARRRHRAGRCSCCCSASSAARSSRRAQADVGAGRPSRPPSFEHLLGTDQQGRDVLANLIFGTPATLKIGIIAGIIGVSVGTLLGLIARLRRRRRRRRPSACSSTCF